VHDVALIPNYFSSGEEDIEAREIRENSARLIQIPYGYKTPTPNANF
jgi:hypothetical protein